MAAVGRRLVLIVIVLCIAACSASARSRPTWVDDLLDPLPVVSQVKTVWHLFRNEKAQAIATQDRFTKRCPGMSQLRSLFEALEGDTQSARQTQEDFLNQPSEFVKNFIARESIKEAEVLGLSLKNQALLELERLMDDAVRRLPTQSKVFFMQAAQAFTTMCLVWAIFRSSSLREVLLTAAKALACITVLIVLDVCLTAALEEIHHDFDAAPRGACCECPQPLSPVRRATAAAAAATTLATDAATALSDKLVAVNPALAPSPPPTRASSSSIGATAWSISALSEGGSEPGVPPPADHASTGAKAAADAARPAAHGHGAVRRSSSSSFSGLRLRGAR